MKITVDAFLEAKGTSNNLDLIETLREFQQVLAVENYRFMPILRQAGVFFLVDLDNSVIIGTFIKPMEVEQKPKTFIIDQGYKERINLPSSRDLMPEPEAQTEKLPADVPESLPELSPEPEAQPEKLPTDVPESLPESSLKPESRTSIPEPESQTEGKAISTENDEHVVAGELTASQVTPNHTVFEVRHLITNRTANSLIESFKMGSATRLEQVAKLHPANLMELHAFGKGCLNSLADLFKTAGITFAKEVVYYKEVKEILNFDNRIH
jgi:hypothetical protein